MPFVVLIRRRSCHCLGEFIVLILIRMNMVCWTSWLRNALNVMLGVTCNDSRFLEFTQNSFYNRSRGLYHCRTFLGLTVSSFFYSSFQQNELSTLVVLSFLKSCIVFLVFLGPEIPNYMEFYWTYSIFEMRPNYLAHKHILIYSYLRYYTIPDFWSDMPKIHGMFS